MGQHLKVTHFLSVLSVPWTGELVPLQQVGTFPQPMLLVRIVYSQLIVKIKLDVLHLWSK